MFRKWIVFFYCLLISCGSFAQDSAAHWYTIKAFLPDWKGCEVQLHVDGALLKTDTITKDIYSYIDTIDGVHQASFQLKKGSTVVALPLFIERGTIRISDKGFNQLIASGTPTNDAYQNLLHQITATALIHYGYDYEKVNDYKKQLCVQFIKDHRTSLLSLQLLKYYSFLRPDDSLYRYLYQLLDSSIKQTYLGRQVGNSIELVKATAVGETVPNLQLPDTLNQLTSLYENHPLTLIDFWASWCAPCRHQNRELVKVFNTYQSKGFTIVSVSLDNNKESWLRAIKSDQLAWKQVSELKGWESPVAKIFHVTAIPTNLLIDSNGKIIARNLHVTTLQTLLAQRLH